MITLNDLSYLFNKYWKGIKLINKATEINISNENTVNRVNRVSPKKYHSKISSKHYYAFYVKKSISYDILSDKNVSNIIKKKIIFGLGDIEELKTKGSNITDEYIKIDLVEFIK